MFNHREDKDVEHVVVRQVWLQALVPLSLPMSQHRVKNGRVHSSENGWAEGHQVMKPRVSTEINTEAVHQIFLKEIVARIYPISTINGAQVIQCVYSDRNAY